MKYLLMFAAGVIICLLFLNPCNKNLPPMETPKQLRKEVGDIETSLRKKLDTLQAKFVQKDSVNHILRNTNTKLLIELDVKKKDIKTLTAQLNTPDTSETVESVRAKGNAVAKECDTTIKQYDELVSNQLKVIVNQDTMIDNRNQVIIQQEIARDSLRKVALKSIDNYEIVTKKLQKRNIGNIAWKLIAGGELILIILKTLKL